MNKYELLLILPGTLDDKQVEERISGLVKIVQEHASAVETQTIGKNRLAYPIQQIRYGYFFTVTFTAEPAALKKLEDKMRINRDVLRFLVSHFNTQLTAQQKIAYTTDNAGVTTMMEREPAVVERVQHAADSFKAVEAESSEVKSANARKIEPLDLGAINKKLDDLMSGDVIPGV